MFSRKPAVAAVVFASLFLAAPAFAGTPLICFPIDTGGAPTLPFGDGVMSRLESYDVARLEGDVLARLAPSAPVLVRMETLRRATIIVAGHGEVAARLLSELMARAIDAEAAGTPDALAYFDAGYLAACFGEMGLDAPAGGHAWVKRAIALRNGDPEMEFAAHVMTLMAGDRLAAERSDHLRAALRGAKEGSLLERNLVARVGGAGSSLAALRAEHLASEASPRERR